jgi:hypothetical protein
VGQVIVLPGWGDLQHYKDRDPTWVKLYRDILTTESWVLGTDASRLVQIACILLAARYQNATPYNFDLFRKVACLDLTERQFAESVEYLSRHKFLEIQGDAISASAVLAECSSEKRREEKRREETPAGAPPPKTNRKADTHEHYPAVQTFTGAAHFTPATALHQSMHDAIGEKPEDLKFWAEVVTAWIAKGWNPRNIAGMYDYFKRRELPAGSKPVTTPASELRRLGYTDANGKPI